MTRLSELLERSRPYQGLAEISLPELPSVSSSLSLHDQIISSWQAHCKDKWPREFAYKPLHGESKLNLVRIRNVNSLDALVGLMDAFANRLGFYISVYAYAYASSTTTLQRYDSAVIDRMYLDFDSKTDPSAAITEAALVMDTFQDKSIEVLSYFSGEKGAAVYIDFPPVNIAPENKKGVLYRFWELVKNGMGIEINTLDGGSLKGDIARVSRLPNTRHKSGLYCIPLENADLRKGIDHIHRLARQPRVDIDLYSIIRENTKANCSTMPRILKSLEEITIAKRELEIESERKKLQRLRKQEQRTSGSRYGGRVTQAQIERARSVPISTFLGSAKTKMVKCPFHNDTVPSLSIDHRRGLWYCFACAKGGTVIQLVMELEGLDFKSAVQRLASV